MELIPSGYDEKHYFVYGQCSEICVTNKCAPVSKLGIFLYDEFKKEYCSLDFSACGNTVTCIKSINYIIESKKEFGRNLKEVYQEITDCLINYLPDYILDNFKQYCEKLLTKEPVGGAKRKEDFKWN